MTKMLSNKASWRQTILPDVIGTLAVAAIATYFFKWLIFSQGVFLDTHQHLEAVIQHVEGKGALPIYSIFFGLAYWFTKNPASLEDLLGTSCYIFGISLGFRYLVSIWLLRFLNQKHGALASTLHLNGLVLSSFLVFSTPFYFKDPYFLIGYISPNIWHNSTLTVMIPWAIVLFGMFIFQVDKKPNSSSFFALLSLIIIINIYTKISFFLPFIVVSGLYYLHAYRFSLSFFYSCIPLGVGVLSLALQYIFTFDGAPASGSAEGTTTVVIKILSGWFGGRYNPYGDSFIPVFILGSYLFPICAIALYPRLWKESEVKFSFLLSLAGLAIFHVLAEEGLRADKPNFVWQCMACNLILFLVLMYHLWLITINSRSKSEIAKVAFLYGVLLLHGISGIFYLKHMLEFKHFL